MPSCFILSFNFLDPAVEIVFNYHFLKPYINKNKGVNIRYPFWVFRTKILNLSKNEQT